MGRLLPITLAVVMTVAVSCGSRTEDDRQSIPFVGNMLGDTTNYYYGILDSYEPSDRYGALSLCGPAELVLPLSERFAEYDRFDNVTGRNRPDGLPDFAGETINILADMANAPYKGYLDAGNEDFLREISVKEALFAVSGKCYSNPYDHEASVDKLPAKTIMIASSVMSEFGRKDIDDLFSLAGKDVPVIDPVRAMVRSAERRHPAPSSVCILMDNELIASGIYTTIMKDENFLQVWRDVNYIELAPDTGVGLDSLLYGILDRYIDTGISMPLSVALIDMSEMAFMADTLTAMARKLYHSESIEDEKYKAILTEEFEFIGKYDAILSECYHWLRENDMFSHKVAYPELRYYLIMPFYDVTLSSKSIGESGGFTDEFKYGRAPGANYETVRLTSMNGRYLPPELLKYVVY